MPITGDFPVESTEWDLIPEDVYQAVIKDIDEKETTKYQSEEKDVQYFFKFGLLEGDEKIKGQVVNAFASRKWFTGGKTTSPSKLVTLVKAVYGFYYPKMNVMMLTSEEMTPQVINDLIGKQVRISVKLNNEKTRNKVADFMTIKAEIELPEFVKVAEVAKKMVAKPAAKAVEDDKPVEPEAESEESEEGKDLPF